MSGQPLGIHARLKARIPDITTPGFRGWVVGEDEQAKVIFWEIAGRAPAHMHHDSTHYLTVISGTLLGAIDGAEYEAPPGTLVIIPRGKRHTHRAKEGEVCLAIDAAVPPLAWEQTVWLEA